MIKLHSSHANKHAAVYWLLRLQAHNLLHDRATRRTQANKRDVRQDQHAYFFGMVSGYLIFTIEKPYHILTKTRDSGRATMAANKIKLRAVSIQG